MDGSNLQGNNEHWQQTNCNSNVKEFFFSEFNSWNWTEQYKLGKDMATATQLVETK
jgi:hypothetical protein